MLIIFHSLIFQSKNSICSSMVLNISKISKSFWSPLLIFVAINKRYNYLNWIYVLHIDRLKTCQKSPFLRIIFIGSHDFKFNQTEISALTWILEKMKSRRMASSIYLPPVYSFCFKGEGNVSRIFWLTVRNHQSRLGNFWLKRMQFGFLSSK